MSNCGGVGWAMAGHGVNLKDRPEARVRRGRSCRGSFNFGYRQLRLDAPAHDVLLVGYEGYAVSVGALVALFADFAALSA